MTRCPNCSQACSENDAYCRHCGAILIKISQPVFSAAIWLNSGQALRALAASALLLAARVLVHNLLMPYMGERHESRVALFHMLIGAVAGAVATPLLKDRPRARLWLIAGLLGGVLNWAFDYAYMANHLVSQAVFYILNWLDSSPDSNAIGIGFGILQALRFAGLVLTLGLAAGWRARRGIQARIVVFSVMALTLRAFVKGYALSPQLCLLYWQQSALYFSSFFVFFYGLGPLDSNSVK